MQFIVTVLKEEEDGLVVNNVTIKYSTFLTTLFKNNKETLRSNLLKSFNISEKLLEDKSFDENDVASVAPSESSLSTEKKEGNPEIGNPEIEISVKNEWFIKFKAIVKHFFRNEYSLISIWLQEPTNMLKTDLLTIFFIRVVFSLSIVAFLSPDNSAGTEEKSSSVNNDFIIIHKIGKRICQSRVSSFYLIDFHCRISNDLF